MSEPHELHFSLRFRFNQIQAIVLAAAALLLWALVEPTPTYQLIYGIVLGFIVGLLTSRMLRQNGKELVQAERTADLVEIRVKDQFGRYAQRVMGFGLFILAGWMVVQSRETGGLEIYHGMSFLAGALATVSFREFLCLPVYRELEALFAERK